MIPPLHGLSGKVSSSGKRVPLFSRQTNLRPRPTLLVAAVLPTTMRKPWNSIISHSALQTYQPTEAKTEGLVRYNPKNSQTRRPLTGLKAVILTFPFELKSCWV